jgi:hypothetical protein
VAHARFGAVGYGVLLGCFAAGSVLGTLSAARTGGLRRPAIFASIVFLIDATALALTPYLGGQAGAAAALFTAGQRRAALSGLTSDEGARREGSA